MIGKEDDIISSLALIFPFYQAIIDFFLFPAGTTDKTSYRTFSRLVFLLRTVQAVGKKPKPQTETNYRSFILEFLL